MRIWISALVASCLYLHPQSAAGQVLRGTVTDRETGEPIPSTSVLVLNADSTLRTVSLTDDAGHFVIRPEAGDFLLRVERLGYASVSSEVLDLSRTDSLTFDVRLPPQPVALRGVGVVGGAEGRFDPSGFYERRDREWGYFLGPVDIEQRHPVSVGDLLTGIPGFAYNYEHGGLALRMTGRGRNCWPTVYVDGVRVVSGRILSRPGQETERDGVLLDGLVNTALVRAVEVYMSGIEAPASFLPSDPGGTCGVIVLWTYVGFGA